jgi:hypothetical protein
MTQGTLANERPCPICSVPSAVIAHGLIAPFIDDLTDSHSDGTKLVRCDACDLVFYANEFSDKQLSAIYAEYRGEEYVKVRRRWEPWYRESINTAFDPGSEAVLERVEFMSAILNHANVPEFRIAIDFGGDGGQFFPATCVGNRFVVDVSNKPLLPGIERVTDVSALPNAPDLVLICHLLEHLNNPKQLLQEVRNTISGDGVLYVEVPLDRPRLHKWHSRLQYLSYLRALRKSRIALTTSDLATGIMRQMGRRVPRLGLVKQSEHINYFSPSSLIKLIEETGFDVVHVNSDPSASVGGLRLGKLGIAARPTKDLPIQT